MCLVFGMVMIWIKKYIGTKRTVNIRRVIGRMRRVNRRLRKVSMREIGRIVSATIHFGAITICVRAVVVQVVVAFVIRAIVG